MRNLFLQIKPREADITREIRNYLKIRGIVHWKQHQGLGSTPGIPDLICCHDGRMVGIEVKTERGIVSDNQRLWMERINRAGGLAFVARSVTDVIERLK